MGFRYTFLVGIKESPVLSVSINTLVTRSLFSFSILLLGYILYRYLTDYHPNTEVEHNLC
jgi:hypothetical protein